MNWYELLRKEQPESPMFTGKKKQEEPEWVKTAKEKTNQNDSPAPKEKKKETKDDEFLEGFNFYSQKEETPKSKTTVSVPERRAYSQFAPKEQGIMFSKSAAEEYDDFVKVFNDPYGEKEEETKRLEKFANIRANADKRVWDDDFLTGLDDPYGEKESERREKFANIRANADKRDWNEDGTLYPRFEASRKAHEAYEASRTDAETPYPRYEASRKAHEALYPHYEASRKDKILDGVSTALTAASFIPWLDTFTNMAQIPVDILRGDLPGVGLDLLGMLPIVGEVADATKTARAADRIIDGGKVLVKATDVVDDSIDTGRALGKASDIAKTNGVGADVAKVSDSLKPILDAAEDPMTEMAKRADDIALGSPLKIPGDAAKKISVKKNGYYQIEYKWNADDGFEYTSRWHTRTPGAPIEQADTFVVERRIPGIGYGKNQRESIEQVLVGENEWVSKELWREARKARKKNIITKEQEEMLYNGHWKIYK